MPWHMCRVGRTTSGSQCCPSAMWVLEIRLGFQVWQQKSLPTMPLHWAQVLFLSIAWIETEIQTISLSGKVSFGVAVISTDKNVR